MTKKVEKITLYRLFFEICSVTTFSKNPPCLVTKSPVTPPLNAIPDIYIAFDLKEFFHFLTNTITINPVPTPRVLYRLYLRLSQFRGNKYDVSSRGGSGIFSQGGGVLGLQGGCSKVFLNTKFLRRLRRRENCPIYRILAFLLHVY